MSEGNHIEETDIWNGPFTEYNKYGRPTGHAYVRCADCGIEVVTSHREHATHRPDCGHADSENGQPTDRVGEHVTGSDR